MRPCRQPSVRGSRRAAQVVRRHHGHAPVRCAPGEGLPTVRSGLIDCIVGHESGSARGCGGVDGRHLPVTPRCHGSCTTLSPRLRYAIRFCASSLRAAGAERVSTPYPRRSLAGRQRHRGCSSRPFPRPPTMGGRPAAASPVTAGVASGGCRRCGRRPVGEWRRAAGRQHDATLSAPWCRRSS